MIVSPLCLVNLLVCGYFLWCMWARVPAWVKRVLIPRQLRWRK